MGPTALLQILERRAGDSCRATSSLRISIIIMSYLRNRISKRRRSGMSGLGDVTSVINAVTGALGVSLDIANDPYLSETVCHIGQLKQINDGGQAGACAETAPNLPGGVGLGKVQPVLRAYVYAQENKWVYAVAAAAILGIPFLIGYDAGKSAKRSSTP